MYERSAIVLERYMEKILGFNKQYNLRDNYNNYKELISETEEYQITTEKEGKIIQEFDETVGKIENIQKKAEKLYNLNIKLEEERNKLFNDLSENADLLENKFKKIEENLETNNEQLKNLKSEYIKYVSEFIQRQKERNKCEKARRISEGNHIEQVKKSINEFNLINAKEVLELKQLINSEKEEQITEITEIMIKNGKNEKVPFNKDVLNLAIKARMDIAEREASCYISIYDKMKKLLTEIDNDSIKLNKYKKSLRDITVKLEFLNMEKEYIVSFLDYERMTAISGNNIHKKMMEEACKNFELDIIQIDNLYELILREIVNKATKKAYKELYNKTYLKNIEDKEKNFKEEANNIKINMGTIINQNYWRIEGIKNIYKVFQNEVSEKFEKDLSEFRIEEIEEEIKENSSETKDNKKENKYSKNKKEKNISDDEEDDDMLDEQKEDSTNNMIDKEKDNEDDIFDDEDDIYDEEDEDDDDDIYDEEDEDDDDDIYDEEDDDDDDIYDEEDDEDDDTYDEEDDDDDDDIYDEDEDDDDDIYDEEDEDDDDDIYDEDDEDDDDDIDEEDEEDDDDIYDEDDEDDEEMPKKNKNKQSNRIFNKIFKEKDDKEKRKKSKGKNKR